jgi:protocatechuate 3,4-dioxygenase, beta subunit
VTESSVQIARRDPLTQSEGVVKGYAQTAQRWPSQPLVRRPLTASELAETRQLEKRLPLIRGDLAGHGARRAIGQLIRVRVRVVDEGGVPVQGAMVEAWHCNAAGKYIHPNDTNDAPEDPNFYGAARLVTGDSGLVELRTIKPGAYPVPDTGGWWRPPHIHFSVLGRVWLSRLVTQMFFPGEPLNEHDAILNAVRDPQARSRCIAELAPTAHGAGRNDSQRQDALVYDYQLVVRGRSSTPGLP